MRMMGLGNKLLFRAKGVVTLLSKKMAVIIVFANLLSAGALIAKAFDSAMTPGEFVPAVIAAVLSGLNIMVGSIFIDFLKESENA